MVAQSPSATGRSQDRCESFAGSGAGQVSDFRSEQGQTSGSPGYLSSLSLSCRSSSILMRSDLKNLRSWSLTLNSGFVDNVVTSEVLSVGFSPCLLTPIVASRTRKMSYPPSLMRATTSEICSESERDSLMASPSSFMSCFSCGSTGSPDSSCRPTNLDAVVGKTVRRLQPWRHCSSGGC